MDSYEVGNGVHSLDMISLAIVKDAQNLNNRKCTKTLSKAPCLVALNMYLTLHLLLY